MGQEFTARPARPYLLAAAVLTTAQSLQETHDVLSAPTNHTRH
jgi:hypothetical protein